MSQGMGAFFGFLLFLFFTVTDDPDSDTPFLVRLMFLTVFVGAGWVIGACHGRLGVLG